ncbi:hypothetical protein HOLleu_17751 [Holothuria leucospilota]|uniref:EF-hand domain-containing protein n=1 Tax=Holothuria leucospilota TaxID=206669 RepID=A0A9Q1C1Q6_HOLLE|nr:hypothetical protein HOLleu_17751 [Holothuria leucospilota]
MKFVCILFIVLCGGMVSTNELPEADFVSFFMETDKNSDNVLDGMELYALYQNEYTSTSLDMIDFVEQIESHDNNPQDSVIGLEEWPFFYVDVTRLINAS